MPVKKPKSHCFFFLPPNTQSQLPVSPFFSRFEKGRMSTLPALPTFFLPLVQGRSSPRCPDPALDPQSVFSTSCLLTTPPPTSLYQDVQMSSCGSPVSFRLTSTPAQPSSKLCPSVNSLGGEPDHFPITGTPSRVLQDVMAKCPLQVCPLVPHSPSLSQHSPLVLP